MAPRAPLAIVALLSQLAPAAAKVEVVRVTVGRGDGQPHWQYVSKFGFGLGDSEFRARVRQVTQPGERDLGGHTLQLEHYLDEKWPEAEAIEDPCERRPFANQFKKVSVGDEGAWGSTWVGEVRHRVRPHVWYLALASCNASLPAGTFTFEVEMDARQPDGSHFSVEAAWSQQSSLVTLLGCSALLLNYWRRTCRFRSSMGTLHPVIRTLAAVVISQYMAQLLHIGHLALYRSNGQGSPCLQLLAEMAFIVSEVVETSLLIAIAAGYTLTAPKLSGLAMPAFVAVALLHVAFIAVDAAEAEASHEFTSHDGAKGWAFLAMRLGLFAYFTRVAQCTADAAGSSKVPAFLRQFQLAAAPYFLAYPMIFLVMPVFAPYWRKAVFEFVLMTAQVSSNLWLASLFLGRGAYYDASCLSDSLLPGGSPRSVTRFQKDD